MISDFLTSHDFFAIVLAIWLAFAATMVAVGLAGLIALGHTLYVFGRACLGREHAVWSSWGLAFVPVAAGGTASLCIAGGCVYAQAPLFTGWFAAWPLFMGLGLATLLVSGQAAALGVGRGIASGFRHLHPAAAIVGVVVVACVLVVAVAAIPQWLPCGLVMLAILGAGSRDPEVVSMSVTATLAHAVTMTGLAIATVIVVAFDPHAPMGASIVVGTAVLLVGVVPTIAVGTALAVGALRPAADVPAEPLLVAVA